MGRSKKANAQPEEKNAPAVFCYFCDRGFPEERVLIQHQLTKHFSCPEKQCRTGHSAAGRCNTLHGLIIHYRKVHVQELKAVPNSIEGRDDPMSNMIIFGTRNVPEEVMEEWQAKSAAPHEIFGASVAGDSNAGPEPMIMGTFATLPEMVMPPQARLAGGGGGLALPSIGVAGGGPDLAAQVAAWMSMKPPEPQEPEQPPLPPDMEAPPPSNGNGFPSSISAPLGFSLQQRSIGFSGAASQPNPIHIDTAATSAMAEAMQNARLASLATSQAAPPSHDPMALALAVHDARGTLTTLAVPRSPSRGRRSPSRDRRDYRDGGRSSSRGRRDSRRSRSREGGGRQDYQNNQGRQLQQQQQPQPQQQQAPNRAPTSVEARTIQITQGTVGTRLILKKAMEGFGRVEVCHTGNRSNPELEPPWVRFEKAFAAEAALAAIQTGQVMLDGGPIMGKLKIGGRPQLPPRDIPRRSERNMEVTSRDLAFEERGGARGGGERGCDRGGGRRSRSPPRRRSRTPPRRDNSRSRGGGGRHDDRRR